jgi:hypothetical protein
MVRVLGARSPGGGETSGIHVGDASTPVCSYEALELIATVLAAR